MSDAHWERDPDPARPLTSVTEAAKAFKRDFRTLQKRIRAGELPGGKYPGKKRWWVYTDTAGYRELVVAAGGEHSPAASTAPSQADDALRSQIADLIAVAMVRENEWALREKEWAARDRDHQEKIRQLMAASALETERAEAAENAVQQLTNALAAVRVLAEKSGQLSGTYRDLLAANYIPDDPGDLA